MGGDWISVGYAVGNVVSSVTLVLLNKKVFAGGFAFPMTLSFFHFLFTIAWYQMLYCCGAFTKPAADMPQTEKFKVALAGFASIGFMNLSLNHNSVGFYQITKLTIIPCTLIINAFQGVHASGKVKLSLCILLAGVGVATVTDVELRPIGLLFGALAVVSTAVFQIWQGTKQKEWGISATQLQSGISVWQSAQALAVSLAVECYCLGPAPCAGTTAIDFFQTAMGAGADAAAKQHTLALVLLTCFIALAVNLCSFGLIGRTSPITFQVVGHAKTCLVLVGGYVLFPAKVHDQQKLINNIAGVSVAMVGVILYGNIKHAGGRNEPDCLDCVCPGAMLTCIEPDYAKVNPSETEGLKSSGNA